MHAERLIRTNEVVAWEGCERGSGYKTNHLLA